MLEQIDFLLETLDERPENADVIQQLENVKTVAVMTPSSEPRELLSGETRIIFNDRDALLRGLREYGELPWTLWMRPNGSYALDVVMGSAR